MFRPAKTMLPVRTPGQVLVILMTTFTRLQQFKLWILRGETGDSWSIAQVGGRRMGTLPIFRQKLGNKDELERID
jgi:hypothetical protein